MDTQTASKLLDEAYAHLQAGRSQKAMDIYIRYKHWRSDRTSVQPVWTLPDKTILYGDDYADRLFKLWNEEWLATQRARE